MAVISSTKLSIRVLLTVFIFQWQSCPNIVHADNEEVTRPPQWKIALEKRKEKQRNEVDIETGGGGRQPAWKKYMEKKKMAMSSPGRNDKLEREEQGIGFDEISSNPVVRHSNRHRPESNHLDVATEDWRKWTKPKFIVKTPGQLALQSIQVSFNSNTNQPASTVKSSKPLNLIQSPQLQTLLDAEKETGFSFSGSLMNRNVPGAPHKPPSVFLKQVQVIIFKLPSTGSTYFAELLQSIPQVHIAKELLTAADAPKPTEVLTAAMTNALRQPMKGHNQGVEKSVSASSLSVIGFTVCPLVLPFANFAAPLAPFAHSARVVVLVRSNTVKHAVGIWRAAALRAKCHTNNLRTEQDMNRCALPTRTNIDVLDFQRDLRAASLHTATIVGAAYATGRDVFEITYEDLQAKPGETLMTLFHFFGVDYDGRALANLNQASSYTKKFTSDNLKDLLVNYYEIESFLRFRAPCYLAQLAAEGPQSFTPCPLPFKTIHVAH